MSVLMVNGWQQPKDGVMGDELSNDEIPPEWNAAEALARTVWAVQLWM